MNCSTLLNRWFILACSLAFFPFTLAASDVSSTAFTFQSEGETVAAILYRDTSLTGARPGLVFSPGRTADLKGAEWLPTALAERGYIVLAQSYRDSESRYYWQDADDIRSAISHLEQLPGVDPDHIGIIGHSRGGMASLLAASRDPRVKSVLSLNAPTDHTRYVRALQDYAPHRYAQMLKVHGGSPEEIPEYYEEVSAVTHAAGIKAPVLLVQGALDLIVPVVHGEWMLKALQANDNTHSHLEILPTGHFFEQDLRGYRFDLVIDLAAEWFGDTL